MVCRDGAVSAVVCCGDEVEMLLAAGAAVRRCTGWELANRRGRIGKVRSRELGDNFVLRD